MGEKVDLAIMINSTHASVGGVWDPKQWGSKAVPHSPTDGVTLLHWSTGGDNMPR